MTEELSSRKTTKIVLQGLMAATKFSKVLATEKAFTLFHEEWFRRYVMGRFVYINNVYKPTPRNIAKEVCCKNSKLL